MTTEGVGEISSLADALGTFGAKSFLYALSETAHDLFRKPVSIPDQVEDKLFGIMRLPALRRLLQALQYFGHFIPFSILPAALASFHSAPHFFSRSRAASCPGVGGFFVLACFFSGAAGCVGSVPRRSVSAAEAARRSGRPPVRRRTMLWT